MAYVRTGTQHGKPCHQPHTRKRFLRKPKTLRKDIIPRKFSFGRMGLMAVSIMMVGTHKQLAYAKNFNHRQLHHRYHLSRLRGGYSSDGNLPSGGGDEQLEDEVLDEYIDFLLAYADDKVSEGDNPLFRDQVSDISLSEEEDEPVAVEEIPDSDVDDVENEEKPTVGESVPQEISATDSDGFEPLVDDVDDATQLDAMVETLVASVDDNELEDDAYIEDHEGQVNTMIIQESAGENEPVDDNELLTTTSSVETIETAEETVEQSEIVVETIDEIDIQEPEPVQNNELLATTSSMKTTETAEETFEQTEIVVATMDAEDVQELESTVGVDGTMDSALNEDFDDANHETVMVDSADDIPEEEQAGEEEVESDAFYLGSSAVENMPLPVNEEGALVGSLEAAPEKISTVPRKPIPLITSFMQKIGLKNENSEFADAAHADSVEKIEVAAGVAEEDAEDNTTGVVAETTTEPTERLQLFSSMMQKIGLRKKDSEIVDTTIVDSSEMTEKITAGVGDDDQNEAIEIATSEVPVTAVSDSDAPSPVITEITDLNDSDEKAKETPKTDVILPIVDASASLEDDKVDDEDSRPNTTFSVKRYYKSAWGSVKGLWSAKRWHSRRITKATDGLPERDYTKIYEKYFATQLEAADQDELSAKKKMSRTSIAFLKPWGTVAKHLKPREVDKTQDPEIPETEYYSIGIKGFITEDSIPEKLSQVDVEAINEEVLSETEVITEAIETDVIHKELPEDTEVVAETSEADVKMISIEDPSEAEIIVENTEADAINEELLVETELITGDAEAEVANSGLLGQKEMISETPDAEEAPEVTEVTSYGNETDLISEGVPEETEATIESPDAEVINEEFPAESEVITAGIETEVIDEDILEDADATPEISDIEDVSDEVHVEIEGTKIYAEVAQGDAEVVEEDTETAHGVEGNREEVLVDLDVVTEIETSSEEIVDDGESITEVEGDSEVVLDLLVQSEEILDDSRTAAEAELDSEEYLEGPETFTGAAEVENDIERASEHPYVPAEVEIDDEKLTKSITDVSEREDEGEEVIETVVEVNGIKVHDDEEAPEENEIDTESVIKLEIEDEEVRVDTEAITVELDEEIVEGVVRIAELEDSEDISEEERVLTEIEDYNEESLGDEDVVAQVTEVEIESVEVQEDEKIATIEVSDDNNLDAVTSATETEIYAKEIIKEQELRAQIEVLDDEVLENTESLVEVTDVDDDSEEVQEDAEIETELSFEENLGDFTETEDSEEDLQEEPEVDSVEALMDSEETLAETDESTPEQLPRRAKIFTRFWGKSKISNNVDTVDLDDQLNNSAMEASLAITENTEDAHQVTPEDASPKPNLFRRLWGTNKHPSDVYSLGLKGIPPIKHPRRRRETNEVEMMNKVEDLDSLEDEADRVDISVSIGMVEEDESFDSLEISESSEVEDIDEDGDTLQAEILDRKEPGKTFECKIRSPEDAQTERNVLQLHSAEVQEREKEINPAAESSIEATENVASTEDSFESAKIYTLQLHKEDSPFVSDDEEKKRIVVEDPSSTDVIRRSAVSAETKENATFTDNEALVEEETDAEGGGGEFMESTGNEDIYSESDEDETFIEELDEEEYESFSILTDSEDLMEVQDGEILKDDVFFAGSDGNVVDDSDEDLIEKEESFSVDEGIVENVEEKMFEELGVDESEEEEEFIENPLNENEDEDEHLNSDGTETAPYSWEVEMQNANFLSRFLVNKGLEQLVMIAIVLTEWIRVYILTPVRDSIVWGIRGKDILQSAMMDARGGDLSTVVNTRGGALASLPSESENDDHTYEGEESEEKEEEALSTGDQHVEIDKAEKSEPNDLQELEEQDSKQDSKQDSEQDNSLKSNTSITNTTPKQVPISAPRKVPPNFIFRRLLNFGFVGRILIMEIILASEWINLYVPQVQKLGTYIVYDLLKQEKKFGHRLEEPENYMTSGFVNIGEGSRLPQKSRKQKRKEDQRALDQLKNVGNVNAAKYRFVSQKFMKRHRLGPYKVAVAEIVVENESSKKDAIEDEETGSDSGWILNALGVEEEDTGSPLDAEVGIAIGKDGPSISVGFEYNIGKKKKKSQSLRSLIVDSNNDNASSKQKNTYKPRVSDSESGIMGRLRAQGANSLVGRSILGAYPGDLPPPDEAADARGVIDMARRYGYGDWSDEDEDELDEYYPGGEDDENSLQDFYNSDHSKFRRRKQSARKTKRRRSSSSRNQKKADLGLNFDLSGSSRDQSSLSNTSRRKRVSSLSSSVATSGLSPGNHRRRKSRGSRLPSLAMETLGGTSNSQPATKRTVASTKSDIKDVLRNSAAETIRKRKTRTKRPAMSILQEKENTSDTKFQKNDQ